MASVFNLSIMSSLKKYKLLICKMLHDAEFEVSAASSRGAEMHVNVNFICFVGSMVCIRRDGIFLILNW